MISAFWEIIGQVMHRVWSLRHKVGVVAGPYAGFSKGGVRKNDGGVRSTPQERAARLGGWYGRGVTPLPLGGSGKVLKFVCKMVASESHFRHILTYSDTGNCTQLEFFIFI